MHKYSLKNMLVMFLFPLIVSKPRQVRKDGKLIQQNKTMIVQEVVFISFFFSCFSKFSDSLFKQISKKVLQTFDLAFCTRDMSTKERLCEHTVRRGPSASQRGLRKKKKSGNNVILDFSLQNCEKINFCGLGTQSVDFFFYSSSS